MGLFSAPPPTRFDLHFSIAGIPVRVHPVFWVIAILLGYTSNDLLLLLIWVLAVFASILIHELGHAFMMKAYGQPSSILLYQGGGLTIPEQVWGGGPGAGVSLSPGQEIMISLAGPFTGFLFTALLIAGAVAGGGTVMTGYLFGVLPFPAVSLPAGGQILNDVVATLIWINLLWGLINLLPVIPLDGGQVARYLLLMLDPRSGLSRSLWLSFITGCLFALVGLVLFRSIYIALLFGFLAFQSYMMLRNRLGGWGD